MVLAAARMRGLARSSGSGGYAAAVLADNPLAYYRLGDVSNGGTMLDSGPNGHNGTYLAGGTQSSIASLLTTDAANAAMNNPGTPGDGAVVAYASWMNVLTTALTVEFLVKTSDTAARLVVREGTSYVWSVQLNTSGCLRFGSAGVIRADGGALIATGTAKHCAMTFDGSNVRFYVDGVLDNTTGFSGSLGTPTDTGLSIANKDGWGSTGEMLTGVIDEVAIYNSVLSGARIAAHAALR